MRAPAWTDSHCHLQDDYLPESEQLEAVLGRAAAAGVSRAVCVGTSLTTSRRALELAAVEAGPRGGPVALWATVGLHPHEATAGVAPIAQLLREVAPLAAVKAPGAVVGVGECGLDYHYEHSPRASQQAAFAEQAALARALDLTLVVHTRDAWEDTWAILAEAGPPERTIIHCFSGGPVEAKACLDLGAYLSFSGIATFKNAAEVREAARCCPGDRLLVETDAPFLAPVPHRGRPNEPAFVAVVGESLAALLGQPPGALAEQTSENAVAAFALAP